MHVFKKLLSITFNSNKSRFCCFFICHFCCFLLIIFVAFLFVVFVVLSLLFLLFYICCFCCFFVCYFCCFFICCFCCFFVCCFCCLFYFLSSIVIDGTRTKIIYLFFLKCTLKKKKQLLIQTSANFLYI